MPRESECKLKQTLHPLHHIKTLSDSYIEIIKAMICSCPNRLPGFVDYIMKNQNRGLVCPDEYDDLRKFGYVDCGDCFLAGMGFDHICAERSNKIWVNYGEEN